MSAVGEIIRRGLLAHRDERYRDFQSALIPTVDRESFIGVRTPDLKQMAKEFSRNPDIGEFLTDLPHTTFDENQLHAFIISDERDFARCMTLVEGFLPYVDNWATCDQLSPKAFAKRAGDLIPYVEKWLSSDKIYTVRFGVGILMRYFLDERFDPAYLARVAEICSDEYYINMMIAWYFATALAKQYDAAIPYLEEGQLSPFVHAKTIQKAIESYRISEDRKRHLRSLKRGK